MAIAIEGYTVVGLKSRILEDYPGGVDALSQTVPNATALADDDVWRCSFMAAADASRFLGQLEQAGFDVRQGPTSDFVLVSEFDLSVEPYCEWLQVARWEKGVIAWRAGTKPTTVVAREGWSPELGSGLQFASDDDNEHLELVRMDGNVAVYFDKRRNREVYVGRTKHDAEEIYKLAAQVILKHFINPGEPAVSGEAADQVRAAVADLEPIAQAHPDTWNVHFFLGKGKLALGDLEGAYQALRRAYELETQNESLPRELAGICLELGRTDEAVAVAEKAAALKPDNFETLSNLAVAYLVAGRLDDAGRTIRAALKLKPDDPTSRQLQQLIDLVGSGAGPQPRTLADLTRLAMGDTNDPSSQLPKSQAPVSQPVSPPLASQRPAAHAPATAGRPTSLWSRLMAWARGPRA